MTKLATCKTCGSQQVAWVTSKKTGQTYLATARKGRAGAGIGVVVSANMVHQCDNRARGGFDPCPHCHRHHILNSYGETGPAHAYCDRYPDAPTAS